MGDVFHAINAMNESLKLGLSPKEVLRYEQSLKQSFAAKAGVAKELAGNTEQLASEYELKVSLVKRAKPLAKQELEKLAGEQQPMRIKSPREP